MPIDKTLGLRMFCILDTGQPNLYTLFAKNLNFRNDTKPENSTTSSCNTSMMVHGCLYCY